MVLDTTLKPMGLNWNKIQTQRYFSLIDDNFINYKSSWASQQMLEDSVVKGTTPVISAGNLQITGSSTIKTNTGPIAAFCTVEASINYIQSSGTYNVAGPALVRDSIHYIAALYDPVNSKAYIQINGVNVLTKVITLDSNYLKIYLILTGNSVNFWAKCNNNTYYIGGYHDFTDNLMIDSVLSKYKYGLLTNNLSSQTITISSLRGGASGGGGLLNIRNVVNEDGSPYIYGNKTLFTADLVSPTGKLPSARNYSEANACVFLMDINTFQVETVGRFYFHRSNGSSEVRTLGGTNIKLSWFPSKKKWLLIYDYFDWDDTNPISNDTYAWLDYEAPFGQTIIDSSQLHKIGINTTTYPNYFYDVSVRNINGTWYALGAYTNQPTGTSWTNANIRMFSGPSIDSLSTSVSYSSANFWECSSFFKLRGQWYISAFSFQDTKSIVFGFPNLDSLGALNLPYNVSSGVAGIPGYELMPYQKNGKTNYYLYGFDSHNLVINGVEQRWSRGNLVVFKSDSVSTGYEFPNKIANQISYPIKDIVIPYGKFPKAEEGFLSNSAQTFLGKKTIDSAIINTLNSNIISSTTFTSGTITGTTSVTSPLFTANGNNTTNSQARFGALEFQSYAVNNNWFGDNTYFNGSVFVRRSAGYSGLFYFAGAEGQFRLGASSSAGSTVTQIIPFKANLDSNVVFGGNISNAAGNYTGATVRVNGNGMSIGLNGAVPNSATQTTSFSTAYVAKSTSYTATISDHTIEVTATGQTMTLPTAVGITGREYEIKLTVSGSCTVATTSSQTIDGATTYSLSAQYKYVTVQSNGANWVIIGNN